MMLAMILTAFGDETGTHDDSPVMMLGGYVARLGQVSSFNPMWRRSLSRAGLPYWHGTEHWDTEAGAKFAPIAQKLVRKHFLFGYVVELDKRAYEDEYLAGGRPNKPQLDTRYGVCFRFLAAFLFTRLPGLIGRNDFVVNFLLEDGAVGSADCKRLLRDMKKQVPETRTALGEVEFGDKKKHPGLQAADALAFGAYKLMPTNPQMTDMPEGDTLAQANQRVAVKPPIYHSRLDAAMLGALKSDILTMVELRKRYSAEIAASRQAAE
jgi:hypothetical protein